MKKKESTTQAVGASAHRVAQKQLLAEFLIGLGVTPLIINYVDISIKKLFFFLIFPRPSVRQSCCLQFRRPITEAEEEEGLLGIKG